MHWHDGSFVLSSCLLINLIRVLHKFVAFLNKNNTVHTVIRLRVRLCIRFCDFVV